MAGSQNKFPIDLLGRYSSPRLLGQGGMGFVYSAEDTVLLRKVAIKLLSSGLKESAALVRFQKEARAAGKLNHPCIIEVLNFGVTQDGEPYLIMEYLEGKTLKEKLEQGKLDINTTIEIITQVCRGLEHAHQKGVLHRDIKSSNIMIDEGDGDIPRARIIDFGIADLRKEDEEGYESTGRGIIGSPAYMSPEAARAEKLSPRSDIYSLGCVLYECLSGHPPFQADSSLAVIAKHLNEEHTRLAEAIRDEPVEKEQTGDKSGNRSRDTNGETSASTRANTSTSTDNLTEAIKALDDIIDRCLAKDPDTRYATARELALDLRRVQEEILEIKPSQQTDAEAPVRRNKFKISAIGIVTILTMIWIAICLPNILYDRLNKQETATKIDLLSKPLSKTTPFSISKSIKDSLESGAAESITDQDLIDEKVDGFKSGKLNLAYSQITKKGLASLKGKPIVEIDISFTENIDDDALSQLQAVKNLRVLRLVGLKQFTHTGFSKLVNLPISKLYLDSTSIDDQCLETLGHIETLGFLSLSGCHGITNSGLRHLKNCKRLYALSISSTDRTFEPVQHLTYLSSLRANSCQITDEELKYLLPLKRLKIIYLQNTLITGSGLKTLCRLPSLKRLSLMGCKNLKDGDYEILNSKNIDWD